MVYRYVRDMLYIFPDRYVTLFGERREVFPWIFNVADALLCTGVALMLVYSLVTARQESEQRPGELKPAES